MLEMLDDRGFDISSLKNYTEDEIKVMLDGQNVGKFGTLSERGPLDIILEKHTGTAQAEKIYVKYKLDDRFKSTTSLSNQINEIFETILTTKDTLIILNISRVLIKVGVKDSRVQELSRITRNLKLLAKEFNVPIIVLSQLKKQKVSQQNLM